MLSINRPGTKLSLKYNISQSISVFHYITFSGYFYSINQGEHFNCKFRPCSTFNTCVTSVPTALYVPRIPGNEDKTNKHLMLPSWRLTGIPLIINSKQSFTFLQLPWSMVFLYTHMTVTNTRGTGPFNCTFTFVIIPSSFDSTVIGQPGAFWSFCATVRFIAYTCTFSLSKDDRLWIHPTVQPK